MGLGAILGGVGALGSLFGVGTKGYGQANQNFNNANQGLTGQKQIADQYGQTGQQFLGQLPGAISNENQSYNGYRNALQSHPLETSQGGTAYTNNLLGGYRKGITAAENQNQQNWASRGFTGPSSMLAGQNAEMEMQGAGQMGQAYGALNQAAIADRLSRAQGLYGLDSGQVGQNYNMGMGALGAQGGALQNYTSGELGIGQDYLNETNAHNEAALQGWSGLSGMGGSVMAMQNYKSMFGQPGQQGSYGFGQGGGGYGDPSGGYGYQQAMPGYGYGTSPYGMMNSWNNGTPYLPQNNGQPAYPANYGQPVYPA